MLGIIDRYILLEVLKAFAAILGTLLLTVLSMFLLRTLEEVNVGVLGSELLLRYIGLQILRDLSSLLPPAFFISVLVALGRMSRDSELIALSACALGPARIYRSLFYLVVPVALVTGWLSFELRPFAVSEIQKVQQQRQDQVYQISGIKQGRFYQYQQGEVTVYVERIEDGQRLTNIFIHERSGERIRLVLSETGYRHTDLASGDQFVTLLNGHRYEGIPGQSDYSIGAFERYNLRIEPTVFADFRSSKRATYHTAELLGSDDLKDRAELEVRIGGPLAVFTLTLLAIPLTSKSPRQRATGRMFLAFLTYFSFFNLQRLATNWFETGFTPDWAGSLWYQGLIVGIVFLILLPEGHWFRWWRLVTVRRRAA